MSSAFSSASLTIVGSGIKSIAHLTTETKAYIENADVLLYLVNEPALKEWLSQANPNSESLDSIYFKQKRRKENYRAITHYILEVLYTKQHVCVVLYGHPTVFAEPALNAFHEAKKAGYDVMILPSVSAEDCLFADFAIDPATHGCQSFEVTDFLMRDYPLNPYSHLILWQVGIIGCVNQPKGHDNQANAKLLVEYLSKIYPLRHRVALYEAAQYPSLEPKIDWLDLENFSKVETSAISTLYIPPAGYARLNEDMVRKLGLKSIESTEPETAL